MFGKFTALILIIGAGIAAVFIVGTATINNESQTNTVITQKVNRAGFISPKPKNTAAYTKQTKNGGQKLAEKNEVTREQKKAPDVKNENYTSILTDQLAKAFTTGNALDLLKDPSKLTDNSIEEIAKNIVATDDLLPETNIFVPEKISGTSLIIIPDKNTEALEQYTKALNKIIERRADAAMLNTARPTKNDFLKVADGINELITDLYALPVPKPFAILHSEQISILTAQKRIFTALAEFENDPVKSLMALKAIPVLKNKVKNLEQKFAAIISDTAQKTP